MMIHFLEYNRYVRAPKSATNSYPVTYLLKKRKSRLAALHKTISKLFHCGFIVTERISFFLVKFIKKETPADNYQPFRFGGNEIKYHDKIFALSVHQNVYIFYYLHNLHLATDCLLIEWNSYRHVRR